MLRKKLTQSLLSITMLIPVCTFSMMQKEEIKKTKVLTLEELKQEQKNMIDLIGSSFTQKTDKHGTVICKNKEKVSEVLTKRNELVSMLEETYKAIYSGAQASKSKSLIELHNIGKFQLKINNVAHLLFALQETPVRITDELSNLKRKLNQEPIKNEKKLVTMKKHKKQAGCPFGPIISVPIVCSMIGIFALHFFGNG